MADQHPTPWRLGEKLSRGTFYGHVTVYDGTRDGDGGRPGRLLGLMVASAARRAVADVNAAAVALERVGPLLSAAELAAERARLGAAEHGLRRLLDHIDAQAATIAIQNVEMERQRLEIERMAAGAEHLVAELRRLLSLHLEGGTELIAGGHSEPEIAGQFSAGYVIAPAARYQLIAEILRSAQEGTHHEESE